MSSSASRPVHRVVRGCPHIVVELALCRRRRPVHSRTARFHRHPPDHHQTRAIWKGATGIRFLNHFRRLQGGITHVDGVARLQQQRAIEAARLRFRPWGIGLQTLHTCRIDIIHRLIAFASRCATSWWRKSRFACIALCASSGLQVRTSNRLISSFKLPSTRSLIYPAPARRSIAVFMPARHFH